MSTQAQKAKVEKATPSPCIARQPILSGDESVVGYELFFREGREERRFSSDGESRCPRPCRAKNATSLPASLPTT